MQQVEKCITWEASTTELPGGSEKTALTRAVSKPVLESHILPVERRQLLSLICIANSVAHVLRHELRPASNTHAQMTTLQRSTTHTECPWLHGPPVSADERLSVCPRPTVPAVLGVGTHLANRLDPCQ